MSTQSSQPNTLNRAKLYQLVLFPLNNGATNVYYVLVLSYIATFGATAKAKAGLGGWGERRSRKGRAGEGKRGAEREGRSRKGRNGTEKERGEWREVENGKGAKGRRGRAR